MPLSTAQKIGVTVGTVVTALGLTYGITSFMEGTPFGPNAAIVAAKFRQFNRKNGESLFWDTDFEKVFEFFKHPYGTKLFAVPYKGQYTYTYLGKKRWKEFKASNAEKKSKIKVILCKQSQPGPLGHYVKVGKRSVYGDSEDPGILNDPSVLQDWEAVNQFLKDHKV